MSHLTVRREIAAPAGVVWDVVGRFDGDQEPLGGLVRTRIEGGGIGSLRTTEFAGGDVLLERLEFLDDRRRSYRSQLVRAGSLPVMDCRISAHVEELPAGHCLLKWDFDFEPEGISEDRARGIVEGVCLGFTNSIKETLEG